MRVYAKMIPRVMNKTTVRLKTARFAALAAFALLAALPAAAQTKIGVVDFQQALLATADMQQKAGALEAKFKPRQDELETLAQELQQIQAQLASAQPADAARLQADGQRKQREAQRLSEDLQSEIDYERSGILQKGSQQMRAVLQTMREEKGVDLILDVSAALAFGPTLDLTTEATAAYDAAHPVN